jgi:hypothetical protein
MPTVPQQQITQIETGRNRLLERAQSLNIVDADTYGVACDIVKGIAELRKTITDDFKPAKEAAFAAHRAICSQEKSHLDALSEPDRIVRGKISGYTAEQEKLRREQEAAAREKARKEAEERKIVEAVQAESQGNSELAEKILETPVVSAPVIVPRVTVPKVDGVSMVPEWKFEVVDPALIPREYLTVDESKIRKVVGALKDQASIPGVRVWSELKPRVTSGR